MGTERTIKRGLHVRDMRDIQPADTCARCGLRRATRELEERGISIRLCDDCYWGREPQSEPDKETPAA